MRCVRFAMPMLSVLCLGGPLLTRRIEVILTRPWICRILVMMASSFLVAAGCARGTPRPDNQVRCYGALREIVHHGRVDGVVFLRDVLEPNLYGVGALSALRGEITIRAGQAHLAYATSSGRVDNSTSRADEESACLLVVASVRDWVSLEIDRDVPYSQLGEFVRATLEAQAAGLDEPWPFLVEGALRDVTLHVIDGRRLSTSGSSHEEHMQTALKISREQADATLIGFYSTQHAGVFIHHDSSIHVHGILADGDSGHLDSATIRAGSVLRLPRP